MNKCSIIIPILHISWPGQNVLGWQGVLPHEMLFGPHSSSDNGRCSTMLHSWVQEKPQKQSTNTRALILKASFCLRVLNPVQYWGEWRQDCSPAGLQDREVKGLEFRLKVLYFLVSSLPWHLALKVAGPEAKEGNRMGRVSQLQSSVIQSALWFPQHPLPLCRWMEETEAALVLCGWGPVRGWARKIVS